ncbi:hypothetical protein M514_05027 [Trichuris suis]|uniref:Uncharacterized protein n=1 Tax=Trichuris suis TaxID=68888 RepID=A0A085M9W2_9BILA|nr:hypothetical protein M513_05027 [Trichuris suis]KFD67317.1 hypothetical protein M514_05027 [Trichuris suis]
MQYVVCIFFFIIMKIIDLIEAVMLGARFFIQFNSLSSRVLGFCFGFRILLITADDVTPESSGY